MRNLSEMNKEELLYIFRKSTTLREQVIERLAENFYDYWCSDILDCFERNTLDTSISADVAYSNRIKINEYFISEFITGMDKVQENFRLLDDEHLAEYNAFKNFYKELNELSEDDEDFDNQHENVLRMLEDISENLTYMVQQDCESCNSTERVEEAFLEWYVEEMTGEWSSWNYTVDEIYRLYRMPKYAELMN